MVGAGEKTKGYIMRTYETMVIVDAMISDEAIAAELKVIEDKIKAKGEVVRRDDWGKRKMAYLINKKSHGYYAIFYYTAAPEVVADLENGFKINDNVLRWMTLADYPMTDVVYTQDVGVGNDDLGLDVDEGEAE